MRSRAFVLSCTLLVAGVVAGPVHGVGAAPRAARVARAQVDWLENRFDVGRTGSNPSEDVVGTGNVDALHELWHLYSVFVGTPLEVAGVVHIAMRQSLLALDPDTGATVWHHKLGFDEQGSLAASGASLYAATSGALYEYAAATGRITYTWADLPCTGGAAVTADTVYIGTDKANRPKVRAFDLATRAQRWAAKVPAVAGMPAVAGGSVFVSTVDRHLIALDATDGSVRWTVQMTNRGSDPVGVDGLVLSGSADGLFAFDAATGAQLWEIPGSFNYFGSPAVAGGVVYATVGENPAKVYAIDETSGAVRWAVRLQGLGLGSQITVANGVIYIATFPGLVALDSDGTQLALYSLRPSGGGGANAPMVVNGGLYFYANGGHGRDLLGGFALPNR
jgi:outer membrane protein assembly factor BamB